MLNSAARFSLHTAVRCGALERKSPERLARYLTRPAIANERVRCDATGHVVLTLRTPWRDGTTHLVMSPLEFLLRLAALVPRPRLHLIRFHGVLAPNARLRAQVVSKPALPLAPVGPAVTSEENGSPRTVRPSWVHLLKRVFDFDLAHCPNCGRTLTIIAAILDRPVIEKIPRHQIPRSGSSWLNG